MTEFPTPYWPEDYKVAPDHCGDVLRGSYDVPFDPVTPPVVLDVGANIGAFSRWASERWPGCQIHAYEPHPEVIKLLHRTIETHSLLVDTHQCAVSNKEGEADICDGPNNIGEGSIVMDYGTTKHKVALRDAAWLPEADVLKLDTEGCELQIIQRLADVGKLSKFSAIMMETHDAGDREKIMALLEANNFTLTKDHIWFRAGGIKYRDPTRTEICYVRTDLVPFGFQPVIKDTSPKKPLVWIATPLRSLEASGLMTQADVEKLPDHYREPLRQLFAAGDADQLPWRFQLYLVGGGGVARARNRIVTDFLASDGAFLFFQDFDLIPTPQDYVTILSRMVSNQILVCGGLYTIRQDKGHYVLNYPDAEGVKNGWSLIVLELGTGFKCYHRAAFEIILQKNPWLQCENDDSKNTEIGFFSMGPVKNEKIWPGRSRWLTEDFWLDWLTWDAGIAIVVDTTVKLRHREDAQPVKIVPKTIRQEEALKILQREFGGEILVQGEPTIFPEVFPPLPQPMTEAEKSMEGKYVKMRSQAD